MNILVTPSSLCSKQELLKPLHTIGNLKFSNQAVPEDLSKYDVIILGNETLDKKRISQAPQLKYIIRYGVTIHNVDIGTLQKRNIYFSNCPGASAQSVAEYTIGVAFYLIKQLYLVNGKSPTQLSGFVFEDVLDKTFGIVGLGNIGLALAKILRQMGVNVIAYNRSPKREIAYKYDVEMLSLNEVIRKSDVLSINLSLTNETYHLFDKSKLDLLDCNSYLINTSQANLIDPSSLYQMLLENKLKGVAMDFQYSEYDFRQFSNVFVTPHISSRTVTTTKNKVKRVIRLITNLANGTIDANDLVNITPRVNPSTSIILR